MSVFMLYKYVPYVAAVSANTESEALEFGMNLPDSYFNESTAEEPVYRAYRIEDGGEQPIAPVILQIHHFESDAEDEYIMVFPDPEMSPEQVVSLFEDALRATNRDALHHGCRFTWLDHAKAELAKSLLFTLQCENRSKHTVIDLDFCKYPAQDDPERKGRV